MAGKVYLVAAVKSSSQHPKGTIPLITHISRWFAGQFDFDFWRLWVRMAYLRSIHQQHLSFTHNVILCMRYISISCTSTIYYDMFLLWSVNYVLLHIIVMKCTMQWPACCRINTTTKQKTSAEEDSVFLCCQFSLFCNIFGKYFISRWLQ